MKKKDTMATAGGGYHPIIGKMQDLENALQRVGVHIGEQERCAVHQLVEIAEVLTRALKSISLLQGLASSQHSSTVFLDKATESVASLDVDLCIELPGHLRELKKALPALAAAIDAATEK